MCKLYDVQADSDCRMSVQTCEDLFNPVKAPSSRGIWTNVLRALSSVTAAA